MSEIKEIIVLFKTHLDVGYTDFAENVVKNYMETYIPAALRVARETRGEKERFIWTTGSWLIERFLAESPLRGEMEEAIQAGDIRWHGLPLTTHTELMDSGLFRYGLSISNELDKRFGMTTTAAKMTDVPGHTRAMVPYLARAGIRFLHLGVNPASSVPEVPSLFRWRAPSGEEVVVMYNGDYGEFCRIGDTGTALYFAHTGDNRGPQSAHEIRALYREIREKYPEASLRAGTLEDVAKIALGISDLPVVTEEIGDSWIHGIGSDPGKVSQYRALLRLRQYLSSEEAKSLNRNLLLIPEHTWGLCYERFLGCQLGEEQFVGEHRYYARPEFEKMRPTAKFQIMEESWQEQRGYLTKALHSLPEDYQETAAQVMQEYRRERTDSFGFVPVPPVSTVRDGRQQKRYQIRINGYEVALREDGSLTRLARDGRSWADEAHPIGEFLYEVFSPEDFRRFEEQYITRKCDWALEEFGKIGMEQAVREHLNARPRVTKVLAGDSQLLVKMVMEGAAVDVFGAPAEMELLLTFMTDKVFFDLAWFGKKASRVAESLWFGFSPARELTGIHKMGEWFRPKEVVRKGGRRLHGVDCGVRFEEIVVKTVDTALAAVGKPSLLHFTDEDIPVDEGVYFNLFNNIWNTNFPMWYDEDARFRFTLEQCLS